MNPSENKKNLDELLTRALGRDPLKFDLDTWKQQHSQEIGEYRAKRLSGTPLTNKRTTKMKSLMIKFAVAAGIIIAALAGIGLFGNWFGGNNVAFAEVLKNFQNRNYSFDVVLTDPNGGQQQETNIAHVTIKEPGKMQLENTLGGIGKISAVTDLNSGKTLILFHQNKTAMIMDDSVLTPIPGFNLFSLPVSALWNLKDGTEKPLGTKEIDGQQAAGFAVSQEDNYFQYQMSIWAQVNNSTPCLVEVTAISKQEPTQIGWTMRKFVMDVQCDDNQFSLQPPTDFTLAYQKNLDQLPATGKASPTAKQIEAALNLWTEDKKDQAIDILMAIDWNLPVTFSGKPYVFSITEQDHITLKPAEQALLLQEVMASLNNIKGFAKYLITQGQAANTSGEFEKAEKYYSTSSHLGELLLKDPDRMILARMVGVAVQKMTLNESVKLYTQTNNPEKLQAAVKQLETVTAIGDEIKRKITGK
jgi:hypothetical protein